MRILMGFMTAAALACAPAAFAQAPPPAPAPAAATPVAIVDLERIYAESLAGRDAQAKVKSIAQAVSKELEPEAKALQAEQQRLGPRFKDKTQEQAIEELKKDPALAKQYQSFLQRLDAFVSKRQLRQQEVLATEQKAVNDVLSAAQAAIAEAMGARGAIVVLNAADIVVAAQSADVTADAISRLNGRVKTVTVTKADLTQRPAAPAAGGQAPPAPKR